MVNVSLRHSKRGKLSTSFICENKFQACPNTKIVVAKFTFVLKINVVHISLPNSNVARGRLEGEVKNASNLDLKKARLSAKPTFCLTYDYLHKTPEIHLFINCKI